MKFFLLFDLDRTLWDFDGNADRTYRTMFDVFELEKLCHVDFETFHERYRVINDMLWEAYRNGTLSKELLSIRRFSLTLEAFGCNPDSPEILRLSNRKAVLPVKLNLIPIMPLTLLISMHNCQMVRSAR